MGVNSAYCCGALMSWKWIDGHYSEGRKCDIRCTSAIGPKCNCQCGGVNHASDWSQLGKQKWLAQPEGDVSGARGSCCECIPSSAS